MGDIQRIAALGDITVATNFDNAMRQMSSVSEGELQFYLASDTAGKQLTSDVNMRSQKRKWIADLSCSRSAWPRYQP